MASIKNLVKFAAKFFEMGKSKKTVKAKPAAKAKSKPATKKAAKKASPPKAKKAVKKSKPVAKKVAKPITKKAVKKVVKPVPKKKATKKVAKPVAKKSVAKKTVTPVAKKKPAPAKPILQKQVKQSKPVKENAVVKEVKPVAKPATKPAPVITTTPKQGYPTSTKTTTQNNVPQMRYSDEDLKEFKELIDGKLVTAREELKNLKEALDNHTESQAGNKAWNMEEGTDTSEMEYLMNQISRQHQYIRNLELALVRIENKTYGICRVTGRLIPKERLRVVPHATMSLEAKMNRKAEEESPAATAAAPPADFSEGFED